MLTVKKIAQSSDGGDKKTDDSGIAAQMLPQTERCPTHGQARTEAYKNPGKLNIIMLLLSRFSPGKVLPWQRDSSPRALFKSFPDQDLGKP